MLLTCLLRHLIYIWRGFNVVGYPRSSTTWLPNPKPWRLQLVVSVTSTSATLDLKSSTVEDKRFNRQLQDMA